MKAEELRIGNWVLCEPNNACIERTIDYEDFKLAHFDSERFKPIPLTEEWLERFEFDEDGFKQYEFINWGIKVKKDPHAISEPNWIVFHGFMNQFSEIVSLKHVHQLQNLFYCLCGEELEIKS